MLSPLALYETDALQAVTGETLRPGGFALIERAIELHPFDRTARLLDVGCGQGATVRHLSERFQLTTFGLDASAMLLAKVNRDAILRPFVQARAEHLPFQDARFQGVISECVLSLTTDPERVLRECKRVLTPGGLLIVTDIYARGPEELPLPSIPAKTCCLQGAVSQRRIEQRLMDAGFKILLWEDHSRLLKELAARLVFTYGSLNAFYQAAFGPMPSTLLEPVPAGPIKPGYFLALARKPELKKC
jgi:arsenite methyltransferase